MRPQINRSVLFRVIRRVEGKVKFRPASPLANRIPVMKLKARIVKPHISERLAERPVPPGHFNGDRFFCYEHGRVHEDGEQAWYCEDGVWMITKEACLEQGGHCWTSNGFAYATSPPQYPEYCKHCPATRVKTPREPWDYQETADRS